MWNACELSLSLTVGRISLMGINDKNTKTKMKTKK